MSQDTDTNPETTETLPDLDEGLENVLGAQYDQHKRVVAIQNLSERTHMTLGQVAKLCEHSTHGKTVASITLQEILDVQIAHFKQELGAAPQKKPKAAKKAASPAATPSASGKKPKADKGKSKPRLDYDVGCKAILSLLEKSEEPLSNSDIAEPTGYTTVQVRAFAKKLKDQGKIKIVGKSKGTKYVLK